MELLTSATNGRPIKFTPERIEQIRNLVERGLTREQIAETIGSTVGSLQVTCSRLGISLRTRRSRPMATRPPAPPSSKSNNGNGNGHGETVVTMRFETKGRTLDTKLLLSEDQIIHLLMEAHMKGITLAEYLTDILNKRKD